MALMRIGRLVACVAGIVMAGTVTSHAAAPVTSGELRDRAAGPMTMGEFRDRYVSELRKAAPQLEFQPVGDDEVDEIHPDGSRSSTFLGNAYQRYIDRPADLDSILAIQTRVALESDIDQPVSADELLALIRPATFLDAPGPKDTTNKPAGGKIAPMTRPFAGDLLVFIGIDGPDSIAYPSATDVHAALPQADDRLWAMAMQSVARRRGNVVAEILRKDLVMVSTNASMASSTLLDGTLLELPDVKAMGPDIAVLIGKDSVLVGRSDDPDAVAALHAYNERYPADWVSDRLYAPTAEGGWRELADK